MIGSFRHSGSSYTSISLVSLISSTSSPTAAACGAFGFKNLHCQLPCCVSGAALTASPPLEPSRICRCP